MSGIDRLKGMLPDSERPAMELLVDVCNEPMGIRWLLPVTTKRWLRYNGPGEANGAHAAWSSV